ncbi:MAG TPA: sigma-70 family RNA polymerase sigma factor [Candidatus Acidoferrum sp.]|nr:sigma-70 family RNA polymerase sigma factor [Candidatus Acidoferrum sp.]
MKQDGPSPRLLLVETAAPSRAAETGALDPFESFFDATYERLLRALYLVTGDRHEAEDLAQEAFVRAYERWDRVSRTGNPAGYLYRTALNAYRSRLRRIAVAARRAMRRIERDPIDESDDRDEIRRALAALPEGQREALVLVEWLGLTDEEAGAALGVKAVTVRVRMTRARQALRERSHEPEEGTER